MKKLLLIIPLLLLITLLLYQKVFIPKHTFKTLTLQRGDMKRTIHGIGYMGAKDHYKIGSIYGGVVQDFNLNEGDFITKGTPIATIDSVDLEDKITELNTTLAKLQTDRASLQIDKESARIAADYQALLFHKNTLLYQKKAISTLSFENFKTNSLIASLKVKSLAFKLTSLQHQEEQLQASLSGLTKRLARYRILSPIDGYITKKFISNHQTILPNQTLLEVVNPKDVWLEASIDTRISGAIKIGDRATIQLRSTPTPYQGYVSHIKPINNRVTNEREVTLSFKTLPTPFYLEEQATLTIEVQTLSDIVKIPNHLLVAYNRQQGVWIYQEGHVHFKPLRELTHGEAFSATTLLQGGERVVIPDSTKKTLVEGLAIYLERDQ